MISMLTCNQSTMSNSEVKMTVFSLRNYYRSYFKCLSYKLLIAFF